MHLCYLINFWWPTLISYHQVSDAGPVIDKSILDIPILGTNDSDDHYIFIIIILIKTATATLVSAFDWSRIDYCNSLLFGSTHDVTFHLQRIQNYATRVILRILKSADLATHLK